MNQEEYNNEVMHKTAKIRIQEVMERKAKIRITELRQLATIPSKNDKKAFELFKAIEKDPSCCQILRDSTLAGTDEEIRKRYNEHVRRSKLPEKNKNRLLI